MNFMQYLKSIQTVEGLLVPKPKGGYRISTKLDRDWDELASPQARKQEKRDRERERGK